MRLVNFLFCKATFRLKLRWALILILGNQFLAQRPVVTLIMLMLKEPQGDLLMIIIARSTAGI
jgi:hypothetical protein